MAARRNASLRGDRRLVKGSSAWQRSPALVQPGPKKWDEFRKRYFVEPDTKPEVWAPLIEAAQKDVVTPLYSAYDAEHNNAVALADCLKRHAAQKKR